MAKDQKELYSVSVSYDVVDEAGEGVDGATESITGLRDKDVMALIKELSQLIRKYQRRSKA